MSTTAAIARESVPNFLAGSGTVGTSEVALTLNYEVIKSVTIKADSDNNNWLMVGKRGSALSGFKLVASESTPPIYVDDLSKIGIVGGGANQAFSWVAT